MVSYIARFNTFISLNIWCIWALDFIIRTNNGKPTIIIDITNNISYTVFHTHLFCCAQVKFPRVCTNMYFTNNKQTAKGHTTETGDVKFSL